MGKEVKTSYAASQVLMEIILGCDLSQEDFEKQTGVTQSQIKDPDAGIPMSSFVKLWQVAIHLTQDPALALHLRKKTGMKMVHFVVQLAIHSTNLLEALFHLSRYARLMSETDRFELSDNGEMVEFIYTNTAPGYQVRWIPEHNFSLGIEMGRSLAQKEYNPVRVNFQHADPGYKDAYDKVFRAPVFFEQPQNSMMIRKKELMHPIGTQDSYLHKVLKNYAESSLERIDISESIQGQVLEHITSGLPLGQADIKTIARKMNMTRSTLYRHLKTEGSTFQELLLKTRQKIAKKHLHNGLTSSQVCYLTGFSEPAAFHRAFKRWYNTSPGEYRKSLNAKNNLF